MKTVLFKHKCGVYNAGDIATFDDDIAARLLEDMYVEEVTADEAAEKQKEVKAKGRPRATKTKEMSPKNSKSKYVTK